MSPRRRWGLLICTLVAALVMPSTSVSAQGGGPDKPKVGKLPHLTFDAKGAAGADRGRGGAGVDAPLEFFCVLSGTAEHEAVLRSPAKPSDIHTALAGGRAEAGKPVSYSDAAEEVVPPQGPPVQVTLEWTGARRPPRRDARVPHDARRALKKPMPPLSWVFVGSRVMDDGVYAADATGYIISVVNFDLTVIDIPDLASNANESLDWEHAPTPPRPPARRSR